MGSDPERWLLGAASVRWGVRRMWSRRYHLGAASLRLGVSFLIRQTGVTVHIRLTRLVPGCGRWNNAPPPATNRDVHILIPRTYNCNLPWQKGVLQL